MTVVIRQNQEKITEVIKYIIRCAVGYLLFYPTLGWNMLMAVLVPSRRWMDEVDEHVIIGALPFEKHVELLYQKGVRAIVNMCRETAGPAHLYESKGIACLRLRTPDFCSPNSEQVAEGVSFMQAHIQNGEKIYVHCKAGRGRSAIVVMCWLMTAYGISALEAQNKLIQCRPHVRKHLAELPVVKSFEKPSGLP